MAEYPRIDESNAWFRRADGLIPAHCQTLAKGPGQFSDGVAPKFLDQGLGAHCWDVDGNEYIDLNMGVGPISLGYCYEPVDRAIRDQLEKGISFSLVSTLEVEVAELIRAHVPCAEMVRFSKTGAEVTSAAIRLARAYTGRQRVLACGYHGWHDWFVSVTDRHRGVPDATLGLTHTFRYDDLEHLKASIDDDTACVIMEPVAFSEPSEGYLSSVKEICEARGCVLIFDEMWTGFRMALGGAQQHFGVTPHLTTMGKAVANGMPLSILAGDAEIMKLCQDDVFFFTTFGGEALSLAAAKATIAELSKHQVPEVLARQGRKLRDGYNAIAIELGLEGTRCVGYPQRSLVSFDGPDALEMKTLVQQEMIARGVLWSGFHTMCFMHSDEDVRHVLDAYREVLPILKDAVASGSVREKLRGKTLSPVFRRSVKPKV